jgi:ubiquitin-conjugating enzyme E2 I
MSELAIKRLMEERKQWRIDHPPGFFAKVGKKIDDSLDVFSWDVGIPGKEGKHVQIKVRILQWFKATIFYSLIKGTDWEGGLYTLKFKFPDDFPARVRFSKM